MAAGIKATIVDASEYSRKIQEAALGGGKIPERQLSELTKIREAVTAKAPAKPPVAVCG